VRTLGIFFWYDTDFWYYFEVGQVLIVAALVLSGYTVSSGVLFIHVRSQESYLTFESIALLVCFAIAWLTCFGSLLRCYSSEIPNQIRRTPPSRH
jgi:hypothetical protein